MLSLINTQYNLQLDTSDITNTTFTGGVATLTAALESLQDTLKCGTNCGSCIPELQRMVRGTAPQAPLSNLLPQAA